MDNHTRSHDIIVQQRDRKADLKVYGGRGLLNLQK